MKYSEINVSAMESHRARIALLVQAMQLALTGSLFVTMDIFRAMGNALIAQLMLLVQMEL